jgi:hypothetical protein
MKYVSTIVSAVLLALVSCGCNSPGKAPVRTSGNVTPAQAVEIVRQAVGIEATAKAVVTATNGYYLVIFPEPPPPKGFTGIVEGDIRARAKVSARTGEIMDGIEGSP